MIQKIGFVLFLVGGAGMDSPDRTIPVIMVLIGVLILIISAIKERISNAEYKNSRKDLLEWNKILKEKSLAQTPTKAMRKAK